MPKTAKKRVRLAAPASTVTPELHDICFEVYKLLREADCPCSGDHDMFERERQWYANVYNGGVGEKRANEIIKNNSLFYYDQVKAYYDMVMADLEKSGKGKRKEVKKGKGGPQARHNPKYAFDLAVRRAAEYAKNPKTYWAKLRAEYSKKYADKARLEDRFGNRAQLLGTVIRPLLVVLEERTGLPKQAFN